MIDNNAEPLQRAREFSEAAHQGQTRDGGRPYSTHPAAVADILRRHGVDDPDVIAAAYLHDVLEDTDITPDRIRECFGDHVAELVHEMTNSAPAGLPFAERHASLLSRARRMSAAGNLIKLADRLHNLSECGVRPAWKQLRYARAAGELLEALRPWPDDALAGEVLDLASRIAAGDKTVSPTQFAVLLAIVAAFNSGLSFGATLNVPTDYPTIQACIDAADGGEDECVVAPGIYHETINFLGKAVTVRSSGGRITDPFGGDRVPFDLRADPDDDLPFLAAAPYVHERLLDSIRTALQTATTSKG